MNYYGPTLQSSLYLIQYHYSSIADGAPPGNFTCRNDSSLSFPLAYLCEGPPTDSGYYHKRYADDYGYYGYYSFIDCPDGSDESPDTCGEFMVLLCL